MNNRLENFLPTSDEMISFLHQIKAEPEDDSLRLIFADWLEEQNDPRGPLMRHQCDSDGVRMRSRSREELRVQPETIRWKMRELFLWFPIDQWCPPHQFQRVSVKVRRGLLQVRANLREDAFGESQGDFSTIWNWLTKREWWPWVDCLEIDFMEQDQLPELFRSQELENLNELNLSRTYLELGGAKLLARSGHLRNLVILRLDGCSLGNEGVKYLAGSPVLKKLRQLHLAGNGITEKGARSIRKSDSLRGLRFLDLSRNNVRDPMAIQSLRNQFPHLRELRLT